MGAEVGEDGDVEDGLGAGGVVIEDDEGLFGFAEEVVDFPDEVFFELGWEVGEEFGSCHGGREEFIRRLRRWAQIFSGVVEDLF